ncbi:protein of unknown function [Methylococcus capsulatus]|uniref:Uncharacterized protein n=1 Tax=Methylococcus capsulatus TaxID=414 RepID=A0AA35XTD9_METCP|nr:protein of unknown function [Methylococcus capsulatus]
MAGGRGVELGSGTGAGCLAGPACAKPPAHARHRYRSIPVRLFNGIVLAKRVAKKPIECRHAAGRGDLRMERRPSGRPAHHHQRHHKNAHALAHRAVHSIQRGVHYLNLNPCHPHARERGL